MIPELHWLPMKEAPTNGDEIIVLINSATVPIIRSAWWDDGYGGHAPADAAELGIECRTDHIGWWSYRHSVTQEMLTGHDRPIGWMPMPKDTHGPWMDVWPQDPLKS